LEKNNRDPHHTTVEPGMRYYSILPWLQIVVCTQKGVCVNGMDIKKISWLFREDR